MKPTMRIVRWLGIVGLGCGMALAAAQAATYTATWAGGGDNLWNNATQWSPNTRYPNNDQPAAGDLYNVTFGDSANTAILNQDVTINTLTFNGTAITNAGYKLTVNGAMGWANLSGNRPQFTGTGTLEAKSGIAFNPVGAAGASNPSLWNNWTINLWGTSTLGNSSGWYIRNTGTLNVTNGATFSINGNSTDAIGYSGTIGVINVLNGGTLNRIAATSTTKVDNVVNNQAGGTVQVTTGGLWLNQGGTHAGAFGVAAGNLLQFGGTHAFNSGATVSGAGNVTFTGAATFHAGSSLAIGGNALISDSVSFAGATTIGGTLTISGGASAGLGGTGDITVTNKFIWNHGGTSGSTVSGSGVIHALGGLEWSNGGFVDTNSKRINLSGASFIDGANGWWVVNDGTLTVLPGASLELRASGGATSMIQGTGTINNQGTFFRSQSGLHAVANPLNNTGTVRADAGGQFDFTGTVLQLSGSSLTGGTWHANGGTINLPGSNLTTIGPGAVVKLTDNAGTISKIGTSLTTINGGFYVQGSKSFTTGGSGLAVGSTGTIGGDGTISGTVAVNGGGTIAPGTSPGVLTVTTLTLADGSVYNWELGFGGADRIDVAGAGTSLSLGSGLKTLNVWDVGGSAATNQSFVLIQYAGTDPTELNATNWTVNLIGARWLPSSQPLVYLDTGNNQLLLTGVGLIPEPSTLWLFAGGLAALGWWRRGGAGVRREE